uniref:N(6)-L-threonylcarbamoyladenine synthase n=1 Tax=Salvator merianae TaxID=96440 RepID=A0A8D0E4K2_SALMN
MFFLLEKLIFKSRTEKLELEQQEKTNLKAMFLKQLLVKHTYLQKSSTVNSFGRINSQSPQCGWRECLRRITIQCTKCFSTKIVLGIETSCDDTGAAVVDESGNILGEALHSQSEVHLKTGGIIPPVAQQLHQENIERIVQEALTASGICAHELSAIATTVKPGLALSLGVGLKYSLELVKKYKKPFIPIHHMEAHALTVRLANRVDFPFLVLLLSGGHCILAVAQNVSDFLLLGQTLDIAPGDMLDKVARRLSLQKYPGCSGLSGGKAIELLAQKGNMLHYKFKVPMEQHYNCNFSFAGLQSQVTGTIAQKEKEEGIQKGQLLSCIPDLAAAVQYTVAAHIAKRTHRAILFCRRHGMLPQEKAVLVVSGGVASNQYIRKALQIVTDATDLTLLCPPPRLCTDNGVMIAWNGIERLCAGLGVLYNPDVVKYEAKAPLGTDISKQVEEACIKVPVLNLTI